MLFTILTFIGFTVLVAVIAWWKTKDENLNTQDGYFLAGRSLTASVIAGSLMLTNLSTEQLVGQAGQSYATNMGPMAWEATSGFALIMLALVFLPRYLKMGITTVPEFLEKRFDTTVKRIISILFLLGYLLTYLPTVLYSGALVFNEMFGIDKALGVSPLAGVAVTATLIGIAGAIYAIFGGLKAVAVSDTVNGVGLLIGGILLPVLTLFLIGQGHFTEGIRSLLEVLPGDKFNAVNPVNAAPPMIPWPVLFTGMAANNMFYWCTNQSIIQRALGAKSLKEAQKGALYTGLLKLLTPLFITSCGLLAYYMHGQGLFSPGQTQALTNNADMAYPALIMTVLPKWLLGFFAAVLFGAILSSFNSALNSSVTLYTLDLHRPMFNPQASDEHMVKVGKRFGTILAIVSIAVAPAVSLAPTGLYDFLQSCFGFYSMPILASVIIGIFSKRVPAIAPKIGLISHVVLYSISFFIPALKGVHYLYILFALFVFNLVLQLVIGKIAPLPEPYIIEDSKVVDTTPWKHAKLFAAIVMLLIVCMYLVFSPIGLAR